MMDLVASIAGAAGAMCAVVAFFLLQHGRLSSNQPCYHVLNILAAALMLFSLFWDYNLAGFVMECFWALFGVVGLVRVLAKR